MKDPDLYQMYQNEQSGLTYCEWLEAQIVSRGLIKPFKKSTKTPPPSLKQFALDSFRGIANTAERLSTGNVSHLGRTIEWCAMQCAEFVEKFYTEVEYNRYE